MQRKNDFLLMNKAGQTILSQLDEGQAKQVLENRHFIITVAEVIRLTCTQNIALRGHDESEKSVNRGNFLEIMHLIAARDKIVESRLHGHGTGNAKYTHSSVQNAIINIMADMILYDIRKEILDAEYFSIIADETKD